MCAQAAAKIQHTYTDIYLAGRAEQVNKLRDKAKAAKKQSATKTQRSATSKYAPSQANWEARVVDETMWQSNGTDALVSPDGRVGGPTMERLLQLLEVMP